MIGEYSLIVGRIIINVVVLYLFNCFPLKTVKVDLLVKRDHLQLVLLKRSGLFFFSRVSFFVF